MYYYYSLLLPLCFKKIKVHEVNTLKFAPRRGRRTLARILKFRLYVCSFVFLLIFNNIINKDIKSRPSISKVYPLNFGRMNISGMENWSDFQGASFSIIFNNNWKQRRAAQESEKQHFNNNLKKAPDRAAYVP